MLAGLLGLGLGKRLASVLDILIGAVVVIGLFMWWLHMHDSAIRDEERGKCNVRIDGMVTKATFDAFKAIADANARDLKAALLANTEAQKRADAAAVAERNAAAKLAALQDEAAKDAKLSVITDEDIQWSEKH